MPTRRADLTGGDDGLQGMKINPIFGVFEFNLFGRDRLSSMRRSCCSSGSWSAWRLVHSPFGRSLDGIRQNARRMRAIGTPVWWRLLAIYTLSAAMAGSAGALSAHSTRFVGLSVLSLLTSGIVTVMLILGGTRRLYGAFVGAVIYYLVQDSTAKISPYFWEFVVGGMLIATVLFLEGGLMDLGGVARHLLDRLRRRSGCAMTHSPALSVRGLNKSFGALVVAQSIDVDLMPGARVGLIGPNGAGKTTFVNLLTGFLTPDAGSISLEGTRSRRWRRKSASAAASPAPIRSIRCWREFKVRDNVAIAIAEREKFAWRMMRYTPQWRECLDEAQTRLDEMGIGALGDRIVRELPYGQQRLLEIAIALALKPRVLLLDEPAAGVPSTEAHHIHDVLEQSAEATSRS